jgi:serine protease DegQ
MLKRLWLLFAQTATVILAVVLVISALRPEWLPRRLADPGVVAGRTAQPDAAGGASRQDILSYAGAAQRAMPAVVNIYSVSLERGRANARSGDAPARRAPGDRPAERQSTSLGSGVIVSRDGIILTNHHVIDGARAIEVMLADGSRAAARLVGSDPETDLAVLRIDGRTLPAIEFGDSEAVRVGDVVLAIGNPFGVGQTVTQGIVSALGRNQLGINTFENFIQTDAAINPGNSGGALIDSAGRLIGINTAIYSGSGGSQGIGFAIPVATARQVLDQLIRDGVVTRGYIGVEPVDLTEDLISAFRLPQVRAPLIVGVIRGGPADSAGIRRGDILIEIEGRPISSTAMMLDAIARLAPGSRARFRLLREGREIDVQITVGRRPPATR